MRPERLLERLSQGHLRNVRFSDARRLVESLGFELDRVAGSHHIFSHHALPELLNLQEVHGEAKPYQLRQLLAMIERYDLGLERK